MLNRTVLALTLVVLFLTIASSTAIPSSDPINQQAANSTQEISFRAGKVCSGAIGGTFRDTVNVPDTYKMSDCEALAKKMVLTVARHSKNFTYSVGCLTANGYSWSDEPGQAPSPNSCNW
jgi:hypothetical protein